MKIMCETLNQRWIMQKDISALTRIVKSVRFCLLLNNSREIISTKRNQAYNSHILYLAIKLPPSYFVESMYCRSLCQVMDVKCNAVDLVTVTAAVLTAVSICFLVVTAVLFSNDTGSNGSLSEFLESIAVTQRALSTPWKVTCLLASAT